MTVIRLDNDKQPHSQPVVQTHALNELYVSKSQTKPNLLVSLLFGGVLT